MNQQAPPGWYPVEDGTSRYWNGEAWTDQIRSSEGAPEVHLESPTKPDGLLARHKRAKEEESARRTESAQAAGALLTSGVFGTSTIEIYVGGYVRVASGERPNLLGQSRPGRSLSPGAVVPIRRGTPYEKLRSIEFTPPARARDAQGESPFTPAVTNLLKGGKNFLKASAPGLAVAGLAHIASTEARTSLLTITTDREIHQLSNQGHNGFAKIASQSHNQVGIALEAAGRAALGLPPRTDGVAQEDSSDARPESSQIARGSRDEGPSHALSVADRLRELADLHRDGILSDDEFSSAKSKLLGQI